MCDAIDVENMIIFASECPNTLTDEETDCEDADPASLQIMSQDNGPVDSDRDYLNL